MLVFFEGGFGDRIMEALLYFATAVITLWSLPFFIFWTLFFIICLYNASINERYWVTGVLITLTGLFLFLTGALSITTLVAENPLRTGLYLLSYFAVAFGWMLFRWLKYIHKVKGKRAKIIKLFLTKDFKGLVVNHYSDGEVIPEDTDLSEFAEESNWKLQLAGTGYASLTPTYLSEPLNERLSLRYNRMDLGSVAMPPVFRDHKRDFFTYFFYWPVDIVVYLLGELLKDVWELIVKFVQGIFDGLAKKITTQKIDLD